jgi:hypothetical protein
MVLESYGHRAKVGGEADQRKAEARAYPEVEHGCEAGQVDEA